MSNLRMINIEEPTMSATDNTKERKMIKFTSPGLKHDVRLKVFDVDFHVHSVILKLYSGFFRKFLDSPEKKIPASAEFAYEWVTQIDEDGSWHLVWAESKNSSGEDHTLKRVQEDEEKLFEKLLHAMYNMPYDIYTSTELLRLTELADYYCALRIVSCTLHAGQRFLWRQKNPPIIHTIAVREIPEVFSAAVKLRNKPLFEDCLIIGAGSMIDPLYKYLEDGKLREQAKDMHLAVLSHVVETHCALLLMANSDVQEGGPGRDEIDEVKIAVNEAAAASIMHGQLELPRYYRKLSEWKSTDGRHPFDGFLQGLLWNWLTLDKTAKSGEGEFEDRFLSAQCRGVDVPWDTEDMDF